MVCYHGNIRTSSPAVHSCYGWRSQKVVRVDCGPQDELLFSASMEMCM